MLHAKIFAFLCYFFQQTIHGLCLTSYMANARMDAATYVVVSRDLSQCDQFYRRELASSPLALLQRLVGHLSLTCVHMMVLTSRCCNCTRRRCCTFSCLHLFPASAHVRTDQKYSKLQLSVGQQGEAPRDSNVHRKACLQTIG